MKNILFIVGSERKESLNKQLAGFAEEYLTTKYNISIDYLDYSSLTFFNQDREFPTPNSILRIRDTVASSDGIWFFTPEYNKSYPGILKNLIDWLSRPIKQNDFSSGTAITGKKCAISGVGGKNKTAGSREKLEELLTFVKAIVLPKSEGFSANFSAFNDNSLKLSEEDIARLYLEADNFIDMIAS